MPLPPRAPAARAAREGGAGVLCALCACVAVAARCSHIVARGYFAVLCRWCLCELCTVWRLCGAVAVAAVECKSDVTVTII